MSCSSHINPQGMSVSFFNSRHTAGSARPNSYLAQCVWHLTFGVRRTYGRIDKQGVQHGTAAAES